MEQHQKNGIAVAKFLETHSGVKLVKYPGLPSHPQHEIMKKQVIVFSYYNKIFMILILKIISNYIRVSQSGQYRPLCAIISKGAKDHGGGRLNFGHS